MAAFASMDEAPTPWSSVIHFKPQTLTEDAVLQVDVIEVADQQHAETAPGGGGFGANIAGGSGSVQAFDKGIETSLA